MTVICYLGRNNSTLFWRKKKEKKKESEITKRCSRSGGQLLNFLWSDFFKLDRKQHLAFQGHCQGRESLSAEVFYIPRAIMQPMNNLLPESKFARSCISEWLTQSSIWVVQLHYRTCKSFLYIFPVDTEIFLSSVRRIKCETLQT